MSKKRKFKWETEPDDKSWTHMGLQCEIKRHTHMGHLCGYVGVGKEHPLFGRSYTDIDLKVEVHGGLTFCSQGSDLDIWWFGFDCAHCDDLCPCDVERGRGSPYAIYRDMEYVEGEVNSLAEQLCNRLKWLVLLGAGNGSRNI